MNARNTLSTYFQGGATGIGLLILRLIVGLAFIQHGYGKLFSPAGQFNAFSWMGPKAPMPGFLQAAAAFSEFLGGFALILGLLTPLAALAILITMFVAINTAHKGAPFVSTSGKPSFELAGIYLTIMLTLIINGPGAYSVDRVLTRCSAREVGSTP